MSTSKFDSLDSAIIACIRRRDGAPIYDRAANIEARKFVSNPWKQFEQFIISRRLQAMRERGLIEYVTKERANGGPVGWRVVIDAEASSA